MKEGSNTTCPPNTIASTLVCLHSLWFPCHTLRRHPTVVQSQILGRSAARNHQSVVGRRVHLVEVGGQAEVMAWLLAVRLLALEIMDRRADLTPDSTATCPPCARPPSARRPPDAPASHRTRRSASTGRLPVPDTDFKPRGSGRRPQVSDRDPGRVCKVAANERMS